MWSRARRPLGGTGSNSGCPANPLSSTRRAPLVALCPAWRNASLDAALTRAFRIDRGRGDVSAPGPSWTERRSGSWARPSGPSSAAPARRAPQPWPVHGEDAQRRWRGRGRLDRVCGGLRFAPGSGSPWCAFPARRKNSQALARPKSGSRVRACATTPTGSSARPEAPSGPRRQPFPCCAAVPGAGGPVGSAGRNLPGLPQSSTALRH